MAPDSEPVKYFEGTVTPLASGKVLFACPLAQSVAVVEVSTIEIAKECTSFDSVDHHADAIVRRLGGKYERETVVLQLSAAIQKKVLLRQSLVKELIARTRDPRPMKGKIDAVAVPTCNRPEALARLLQCLRQSVTKWERPLEVVVMDDSASRAMQERNLSLVRRFAEQTKLVCRYGNASSRARFAGVLSRYTGVSNAQTIFAVGKDKRYSVHTGACRNSLQLQLHGRMVMCVDDDVIFRTTAPPDSVDELVLATRRDSFTFFESRDEIEALEYEEEDIIGQHEGMLCTTPEDLARTSGSEGFNSVSPGFLRRLQSGYALVVSQLGLVGDVALNSPLTYFLDGPETLGRLTASEELYSKATRNRLALRSPKRRSISERMGCMSYCMGVDNRDILPPFCPVQRAQEFVWSSLIDACIPGALFAILPRAVLHSPLDAREFPADAAVQHSAHFNCGELLAFLIMNEKPQGHSREQRMTSLARRLEEISELPERDFVAHLWGIIRPVLAWWIRGLDAALDQSWLTLPIARLDIARIRQKCLDTLNQENGFQPYDLAGGVDTLARFQCLLHEFATLLSNWPTIVSGVELLASRGSHLAPEIHEWQEVSLGEHV